LKDMSKSHRFYPHIDVNKRFANFAGEKHESVFWRSLIMCAQAWFHSHRGYAEQLAAWTTQSRLEEQHKAQELLLHNDPVITWIGHSTFLIQIAGMNILTDPVFFNLPLFRRITQPGVQLDALPTIHAVIISHNHYDHMEETSIRALFTNNDCVFYVPQGDKDWFEKRGCQRVVESMWWDRHTLAPMYPGAPAVTLSFLPAFHWSQRGLFDHNSSLWGSWMIEADGKHVYFGGDSAYGRHYKAIAQEFPSIDVALMPIGPCEPRQWMKLSHLGPEEAGQAFLELRARHFIPMHWGTYWFGIDAPLMPIERITAWWQTNQDQLRDCTLHALKIGETRSLVLEQPFVGIQKQPTVDVAP
jgi:L-ascorbate metabolism protein UlaG (beta-lactamase superfamily)